MPSVKPQSFRSPSSASCNRVLDVPGAYGIARPCRMRAANLISPTKVRKQNPMDSLRAHNQKPTPLEAIIAASSALPSGGGGDAVPLSLALRSLAARRRLLIAFLPPRNRPGPSRDEMSIVTLDQVADGESRYANGTE